MIRGSSFKWQGWRRLEDGRWQMKSWDRFSNLPLIGIMSTDEKPNDHSFALNAERPVIAIHSCRPIRANLFEMKRWMPMIFQPEPELFSRLSPDIRSECGKLFTECGARRGLHVVKWFCPLSVL